MKKIMMILTIGVTCIISATSARGMDAALQNVVLLLTETEIVVWSKDPIIVNAVKEANKKPKLPLGEIDLLDKKWQSTEGVDDWINSFLNNECAIHLKKFQNKQKGERTRYPEIFVMDQQGLIVAETDKTSDYWQGDENKFIQSFAEGKGSIFIDEPDYDESTNSYSIQVSVPVLDPDTEKAIGAMTVGIDLDALSEYILDL